MQPLWLGIEPMTSCIATQLLNHYETMVVESGSTFQILRGGASTETLVHYNLRTFALNLRMKSEMKNLA